MCYCFACNTILLGLDWRRIPSAWNRVFSRVLSRSLTHLVWGRRNIGVIGVINHDKRLPVVESVFRELLLTMLPVTWSTGTVHTSVKPRLTSVAISCAGDTARCVQRSRCPAVVGRWRNNVIVAARSSFPYLPSVSNQDNNPWIETVIRIATKIKSYLPWPIANRCVKFMQIRSEVLRKVVNTQKDRQTDKQTDKQRRKHILLGGVTM